MRCLLSDRRLGGVLQSIGGSVCVVLQVLVHTHPCSSSLLLEMFAVSDQDSQQKFPVKIILDLVLTDEATQFISHFFLAINVSVADV